VKLLFDHNLSPRLITLLRKIYPDSEHVYAIDMHQATDRVVWEYARAYGYVIATRDSDFNDLSVMYGFPPKIIWIRRGNCATRDIEEILRKHRDAIELFEQDSEASVLMLY
jgi:predicted nuclease of predicted toxin-antitoxin system